MKPKRPYFIKKLPKFFLENRGIKEFQKFPDFGLFCQDFAVEIETLSYIVEYQYIKTGNPGRIGRNPVGHPRGRGWYHLFWQAMQ